MVSFVQQQDRLSVSRAVIIFKKYWILNFSGFTFKCELKKLKIASGKKISCRTMKTKILVSRDELIVQNYKFQCSTLSGYYLLYLIHSNCDGKKKNIRNSQFWPSNIVNEILTNMFSPTHSSILSSSTRVPTANPVTKCWWHLVNQKSTMDDVDLRHLSVFSYNIAGLKHYLGNIS